MSVKSSWYFNTFYRAIFVPISKWHEVINWDKKWAARSTGDSKQAEIPRVTFPLVVNGTTKLMESVFNFLNKVSALYFRHIYVAVYPLNHSYCLCSVVPSGVSIVKWTLVLQYHSIDWCQNNRSAGEVTLMNLSRINETEQTIFHGGVATMQWAICWNEML